MFMLSVIVSGGLFALGMSLPIFNYDRASDATVADKRLYLERIQTLFEDRRIDNAGYIALHTEQASVSFFDHAARRETFRDPMVLYPLLASVTVG